MKTFEDVLNYCKQTVQRYGDLNQNLLTRRTDYGEFQVYNKPFNFSILITPRGAEIPTLQLEYNGTSRLFTVRTICGETSDLHAKNGTVPTKEYKLSENLTEIINDRFDSYLLIESVAALLKLNLD